VSLLLDLKTDLAVAPLALWMASRTGTGFAVCTDSLPGLMEIRRRAPHLARWLSLPDLGPGSFRGMRGALSGLLRQWSGEGRSRLGQEIRGAVADVRRSGPSTAIPRLGSVPYRAHLPTELRRLASDVGASALSLHHWVVTREVCDAAHAEGLPVAAWTVNRGEAARRLIECGVDLITTDRVDAVRGAV
jgi:hypothetical protein